MSAERFKKRLPVPYTDWLPEALKRNLGKWVDRKFHGYGIIEHVSATGERIFTVKVGTPPNFRVSVDTLKKFVEIADTYGIGALRITRNGNVEFMADSLENALKIKEAVEKLGFPVGGWGPTIWSINSCTAFLTCTTAVVDAPSITKVLYDALKPYFTGEITLPAKLRINVSGCPSSCGGFTADINLVGHYGDAPTYDPERIKLCLPKSAKALEAGHVPEVAEVCPTNAIKVYGKPDGSVGLDIIRSKCIACGRCRDVCDWIDFDQSKAGVAVLIGGKASNTGRGPLPSVQVIPWVPAIPPAYREIVAVVKKIIDVWRQNAREGERLGDWVHRIGMEKFYEMLNIPVTKWNKPVKFEGEFGIRQFLA
ncbi:dissimilatory-type sulfite reductase subunit beta [Pyrobaculum calidifontis]|uniref:Dissimilatory sulfite reductase beta subunit n=1 Tax=Pyrobaculum calidifontis (strain DSM 21063 / JCM 11548 / VA1) TaxID=410359 RepID=A3MW59_PYRCJ|nr:dissimilatory-type sulfite reductase subunit beta [Pyrobaculum calidifontis]ABO08876.1 dissimilatory sulfite reductase beta subunit [Pyrobaculum calidifontis JCM 11548]